MTWVWRIAAAIHAAGATVYWWLQPRSFELGSRSFFEHEVIVPAFMVVAWAAVGISFTGAMAAAIVGAFWIVVAGTFFAVGNTTAAWLMSAFATGGLLVVASSARKRWGAALVGTPIGTMLGIAFLFCTWAPPATTRPLLTTLREQAGAQERPGPARIEWQGMGARVDGSAIVITWRGKQWRIWPGPEFTGVADSGAWSLFDYRESRVDGWTVIDNEPPHEVMDSEWGPKPFIRCSLRLRSTTPDFTTEVHVVFDGRCWGPYINIRSHFPRALAAHLGSMLRISGPGELSLPTDYGAYRSGDFLVLRDSGMELLRPAHEEKGPYETIMKWNMQFAPTFNWDSEEVTIRGWHGGASLAESPTAGWGVPQGAIERVDNDVVVSLAATAVGRGWHTVRTAPGTYALGISFGR